MQDDLVEKGWKDALEVEDEPPVDTLEEVNLELP